MLVLVMFFDVVGRKSCSVRCSSCFGLFSVSCVLVFFLSGLHRVLVYVGVHFGLALGIRTLGLGFLGLVFFFLLLFSTSSPTLPFRVLWCLVLCYA